MIYEHCFFCKLRSTVQENSVRDSVKSANLDLLVIDSSYALVKIKGGFEQSQLPNFISRLKNTMFFSKVDYSKTAYIGKA